MWRLWWVLAGCNGLTPQDDPGATAPEVVEAAPAPLPTPAVRRLSQVSTGLDLELPEGNLAPGRVPGVVPLRGVADKVRTEGDVDVWRTTLPFHPRLMLEGRGDRAVGTYIPEGFSVSGPQGRVAFDANPRPGTWSWEGRFLLLRTDKGAPAPDLPRYKVIHTALADVERDLSFESAGTAAMQFALRRLQTPNDGLDGVYLPAPATATWTLSVAPGEVFDATVRLIASPVRGTGSDGASVVLEAVTDTGATELGRAEATVEGVRLRASLDTVAGDNVRLRLRSDPGATRYYDYVMVVDPVVYKPDADARQVVLVYLDTTRADALGIYGATRPTTPALDAFAKDAVVFDAARTVAPWTLPSVRAVLTGEQPEHWREVTTLPERLQSQGFATAGVFANVYMTRAFDMDRGWTRWSYALKKPAEDVVNEGLAFLAEHADRDALLVLQFMDTHLPYQEPESYRGMWAKEPWKGTKLGVYPIRGVKPDAKELPALQAYVRGRYDQSMHYVDDQLARLFAALDDDAIVVIFADHGEEMWDHGGYEHGHTFYDELMRVPLVIKAPSVKGARVAAPVSLLDVTPTVLDLLGRVPPEAAGRSLVSLLLADPGAAAAFEARPLAFGRPLYDDDGWGVIVGTKKWWSRSGTEVVYDLAADPKELTPLSDVDMAPLRDALGTALGTTTARVWKLQFSIPGMPEGLTLRVSHPAGLTRAWRAYEPRAPGALSPQLEGGALVYTHPANTKMPRAFYVAPAGDPADLVGLHIELTYDGQTVDETVSEPLPDGALDRRSTLFAAGPPGLKVLVQPAWVPLDVGEEVPATADEATEELEALGYVQ